MHRYCVLRPKHKLVTLKYYASQSYSVVPNTKYNPIIFRKMHYFYLKTKVCLNKKFELGTATIIIYLILNFSDTLLML